MGPPQFHLWPICVARLRTTKNPGSRNSGNSPGATPGAARALAGRVPLRKHGGRVALRAVAPRADSPGAAAWGSSGGVGGRRGAVARSLRPRGLVPAGGRGWWCPSPPREARRRLAPEDLSAWEISGAPVGASKKGGVLGKISHTICHGNLDRLIHFRSTTVKQHLISTTPFTRTPSLFSRSRQGNLLVHLHLYH